MLVMNRRFKKREKFHNFQIYAWHTQTEKPNFSKFDKYMRQEDLKSSNVKSLSQYW